MSLSDPVITGVDILELPTNYPRTVGRNARLGSHGSGGTSTVALLWTDTANSGWGLIEGPPPEAASVVGRTLSELIDPATGVRDDSLRWLDIALHDLLGVVTEQPVHALLGGRGES